MSLRNMFMLYATVIGFASAAMMIGAIKVWDVYRANRKHKKQATFIKADYHRIRAQQLVADMKRRVK